MKVIPNNLYTGKCTDEQYEKINANKKSNDWIPKIKKE